MKRVYVNEEWCLGCHLCEYNCTYANSGIKGMVKALKDKKIYPRIHIESDNKITYAVSCRHCSDPVCVRSCISGALSIRDGAVFINHEKCVGCFTCILVCPFGAVTRGQEGVIQKCELCVGNSNMVPACVTGCPNKAIVYEER